MEIDEIYTFLVDEQGVSRSKLFPDSNLERDLGIEGDDFSDLMEAFAQEYSVDMSSYLWYFHHEEEGWNFGSLFFKPPNKQVETIEITPKILLQAAISRVWPVCYPEHKLKKGRPDIICDVVFLISLAVVGGAIWFTKKFGG